jgi:hypothetical protein
MTLGDFWAPPLYLRVSTARQAEHDVSIPDQRRQGEAYCKARGFQLVETYVEPGASATNDRRPEFQRMIEAGTSKPAPFDIVIVHSFSCFFRDHFELEFYVRELAKRLLRPERLEKVLTSVLDRRRERTECRQEHIAELNNRAAGADARLKRLYDAIESGVADLDDPALKERIAGLKAIRDQAQADAQRPQAMVESSSQRAITGHGPQVREDRARADADRRWRLPARPSPGACPAGRGRGGRSRHHWIEG